MKEKFQGTRGANLIDIRINLRLKYCGILNTANEVIEKPFYTYYLKSSAEEGGILQVINKYEMININPYIIVLEDRSIINIYSYLEQDKQYRYKINECKHNKTH
jgi:hypothetical protein